MSVAFKRQSSKIIQDTFKPSCMFDKLISKCTNNPDINYPARLEIWTQAHAHIQVWHAPWALLQSAKPPEHYKNFF